MWFTDTEHVNISSKIKLGKYLGDILSKNFVLKDGQLSEFIRTLTIFLPKIIN